MRKHLVSFISVLTIACMLVSCQREIHFDIDDNSHGALVKTLGGDCLPIQVGGTFIAGQQTGDSNFINVSIHITSKGKYQVSTDTVNGVFFHASGNFSDTGILQVKLIASGSPQTAGVSAYTVRYDGSVCKATITVINSSNGHAEFTMTGTPGICANFLVEGGYAVGVELDSSNRVTIALDVTKPGTYSITTNALNGYSFSGSGTLAAIGTITVVLTATGSPVTTGQNVFSITTVNSACTFTVNVSSPVTVVNNDYFPLTDGSHWTYDDLFRAGDSVTRFVDGSSTIGVLTFKLVKQQNMFGPPDSLYFRKQGTDYFEYVKVDKYTNSFQYGAPFLDTLHFLKENLTTGDKWNSREYSALADFGQVIVLQYLYSCTNANAAVNIHGKTYTNVYKIIVRLQLRTETGDYGFTGDVYTNYFAKGVGLIYSKHTRDAFTLYEWQLRDDWLVN